MAPSGHSLLPGTGSAEPARRCRRPKDMTPSRLAIVTAAATLLGLGATACGSQAGTATGQPAPHKLHLSTSASPAATPAPGAPMSILPSPAPPGMPGWAQVKLTGRLPSGGPARGAVRSLPGSEAPAAAVRALASALHLTGTPQRVAGGWRVTGSGTLQVADGPGLRWTYLGAPVIPRCGPISRPQTAPGAANASTGSNPRAALPAAPGRVCPMKPGQLEPFDPVPAPSTGPPSGPSAQAAAMPVLQAAGVAGSPLRITTIGSYTFVTADPVVGGLPTAGFATSVGVGTGDRITQASGWLSRTATGSSYPLIGAQQAFDRLKQSTHPVAGAHPPEVMCPLSPDTLCNPGPIRVVQVTGAAYGLALSYNRGEPVLVPAWLFSVAGTAVKVPQVAINPRYLTG
jgi:hypothetical protein